MDDLRSARLEQVGVGCIRSAATTEVGGTARSPRLAVRASGGAGQSGARTRSECLAPVMSRCLPTLWEEPERIGEAQRRIIRRALFDDAGLSPECRTMPLGTPRATSRARCADDETHRRVTMHIDADALALVALGEGDPQERAHAQQCPKCRSELESLGDVSRIIVGAGPMPLRPPERVWAAIESAIQQEVQAQLVTAATGSGRVWRRPADEAPAPVERSRIERLRTASAKRRFTGRSMLGAAAAGAVLAWLGATMLDGIQGAEDRSVLASIRLESLDDSVPPGAAQIVERDGQRMLEVEAGRLPEVADGYLQVWLLQQDAPGMVTVGLLDQGDQWFVLPEGLSTGTFDVVDVSVEHDDGDPSHSGESLWRGPIRSP